MESGPKLQVGVIFGGRSGEYEISLMSARSVLGVLDPAEYIVTQIGITPEGTWLSGEDVLETMERGEFDRLRPVTLLADPTRNGLNSLQQADGGVVMNLLTKLDVIFPVLHGTFGEDGTLQGLLDMAGVAYVGAGVVGSAVGMDKGVFEDVMLANHIPVPKSMVVLRRSLESHMPAIIDQAEQIAPYPIFVKPANLGSSVGVSKCHSRSDLLEGLLEAARFDRRILIQQGINAREIEVSVLGNDDPEASVPGEVIPSREFYSYEAKYIDNASQLIIPAPIPEATSLKIRQLAVQAYKAIDCQGMARVDFLLDRDTGEVYLNELNTIPGFTSISMYPKLWEASGLPYPELINRLIELALERKADRQKTSYRYGG